MSMADVEIRLFNSRWEYFKKKLKEMRQLSRDLNDIILESWRENKITQQGGEIMEKSTDLRVDIESILSSDVFNFEEFLKGRKILREEKESGMIKRFLKKILD